MSTIGEFLKWFHVEDYAVVAGGERIGTVAGVTREPPTGHAILVDVETGVGLRRIALPFDAVHRVDGDARIVEVAARPERLRAAPAYDPVREAPTEAYLRRVAEHLARA